MTEKQSLSEIKRLWDRFDKQGSEGIATELGDAGGGSVADTLRGLAHYHDGEYVAARCNFETVLAADSQNPIASLYLALVLFRLGMDREAGELLSRIVIFPHPQWLAEFLRIFWPLRFTTALGLPQPALADSGFADPYAADYLRWQEHAPRIDSAALDDPSREGVSSDLKRLIGGLFSEQLAFERSARKLGEHYADKAAGSYHSGDLLRALRLFERAQTIRPNNEMVTANLAYVYLLHRRVDDARRILAPFFDRAIEGYEQRQELEQLPHADTIVCYAWCLHEQGRNAEALRLLSVVQPEGPDDWGSHFVASVCWLMKGDDPNFRRALEGALGPYFIDTWEQILRPFVEKVRQWLQDGGRNSSLAEKAPELP